MLYLTDCSTASERLNLNNPTQGTRDVTELGATPISAM